MAQEGCAQKGNSLERRKNMFKGLEAKEGKELHVIEYG
jgi:hypothetical protein